MIFINLFSCVFRYKTIKLHFVYSQNLPCTITLIDEAWMHIYIILLERQPVFYVLSLFSTLLSLFRYQIFFIPIFFSELITQLICASIHDAFRSYKRESSLLLMIQFCPLPPSRNASFCQSLALNYSHSQLSLST